MAPTANVGNRIRLYRDRTSKPIACSGIRCLQIRLLEPDAIGVAHVHIYGSGVSGGIVKLIAVDSGRTAVFIANTKVLPSRAQGCCEAKQVFRARVRRFDVSPIRGCRLQNNIGRSREVGCGSIRGNAWGYCLSRCRTYRRRHVAASTRTHTQRKDGLQRHDVKSSSHVSLTRNGARCRAPFPAGAATKQARLHRDTATRTESGHVNIHYSFCAAVMKIQYQSNEQPCENARTRANQRLRPRSEGLALDSRCKPPMLH